MVAEIGRLVGQSEVEQIRTAIADQERLRGERDDARELLAVARFDTLRTGLADLKRHVGHQNGRLGDVEDEVDGLHTALASRDGVRAGRAMAASMIWKLIGTGLAAVAAAAAVGAAIASVMS